jgi:hypothetical protein
VILLREPTEAQIERFLEAQRSSPFSYPEVGVLGRLFGVWSLVG